MTDICTAKVDARETMDQTGLCSDWPLFLNSSTVSSYFLFCKSGDGNTASRLRRIK